MIMCNGPVSFKLSIQRLTAQSTMEVELVIAALATKEAVYCADMVGELGVEVQAHPNPHRLHFDPARGREQDLQLACETLGSKALLRSRYNARGQDQHPIHFNRGQYSQHRDEIPQQAPPPVPHRAGNTFNT